MNKTSSQNQIHTNNTTKRLLAPINAYSIRNNNNNNLQHNSKSLARSPSFSIYNPNILSNKQQCIDIENLKEELIKLKTDVKNKRNEIFNYKMRNISTETQLQQSLSSLEKILSLLNINKVNSRLHPIINPSSSSSSITNANTVIPNSRDTQYAISLRYQNEDLLERISLKEKEIQSIKDSDKGNKYINMNDKLTSKNESIVQLQNDYMQLKHNYTLLQNNYNKDNNDIITYKSNVNKLSLQNNMLSKRNEQLSKQNEHYEEYLYLIESELNAKIEERLQRDINMLNKQIEELCNESEGKEDEIKRKQNEITNVDNDINSLNKKCDELYKQIEMLQKERNCVYGSSSSSKSYNNEIKDKIKDNEIKIQLYQQRITKAKNDIHEQQDVVTNIESEYEKVNAEMKALESILNDEVMKYEKCIQLQVRNKEMIVEKENELFELKQQLSL